MVTSSTILSGWLLCFKNRLRLGHFPEIFENTETNYCRTYLIILASVHIFLWLWYFWHKIALMIFISLSCCDLTAIHCIKNEIFHEDFIKFLKDTCMFKVLNKSLERVLNLIKYLWWSSFAKIVLSRYLFSQKSFIIDIDRVLNKPLNTKWIFCISSKLTKKRTEQC